MAITPDGTRAYVTNGTLNIPVIDTASNTVVATVLAGMSSNGIAITPDGTRAYVTNDAGTNIVLVIDTDPTSLTYNTVVATVSTPNIPLEVAITPDGTNAYVTNGNNNVSVIDTDPLSPTFNTVVVPTILVGSLPFGVAITPDRTRAYVANRTSFNVSVINTASNTVVATIPSGNPQNPHWVAITPDGKRAYVAHRWGPMNSIVSVIDTDPSSPTFNTVVATVPINVPTGDCQGVAITPDSTRAYVTDIGDIGSPGTVPVINTLSNTVVATVSVDGRVPIGVAITCDLPTGETTISDGWANDVTCFDPFAPPEPCATVHKWRQILTPTTIDFSGRTVIERDPGGGGPDTCWFPTSRYLPADAITGGSWLVGSGNNWGPDFVGYIPQRVRYDRDSGRAPCGTRFPQKMTISCPLNYPAYVTNELTMDIGLISVSSGRAGQTQTRIWP